MPRLRPPPMKVEKAPRFVKRHAKDTELGVLVCDALAAANLTQKELSLAIGATASYVCGGLTGHQKPSPEWVSRVAAALHATPEQRCELHRAAARVYGFQIDGERENSSSA